MRFAYFYWFTKIRGQYLEITLDKISNSWELKGISKLSIWFIASIDDRNAFSFQIMFTVGTLDRYIDLEFSLLFIIKRFFIYFKLRRERQGVILPPVLYTQALNSANYTS